MRIVSMKTAVIDGLILQKGMYYALPEEIAIELVNQRLAYWENDDPPFDEATIREMNRVAEGEAEVRKNVATKLRLREKREAALAERVYAAQAQADLEKELHRRKRLAPKLAACRVPERDGE